MLTVRTVEHRVPIRDDVWLADLLDDIWGTAFDDIERLNEVSIEFTRHWKTRLGLIRMTESQSHTYIGINGLLRHPDVPEVVVLVTIAHELCHYAHGFGSPLPQRYSHPHAGKVVDRELEQRGLGRQLLFYGDWIADRWHEFYERHAGSITRLGKPIRQRYSRAAAAAGTPR